MRYLLTLCMAIALSGAGCWTNKSKVVDDDQAKMKKILEARGKALEQLTPPPVVQPEEVTLETVEEVQKRLAKELDHAQATQPTTVKWKKKSE